MEKRCYGCMKLKQAGPVCEHCGFDENRQNDLHQLPVGTLLRGQYRVGKVLGQGGFGITYLGYDENLEGPVAIKEYFPAGMVTRSAESTNNISVLNNNDSYQNSLARFLREARSLEKLNQVPGIVRVKNLFAENGTAYIVMEYLEGMDLGDYLRKKGSPLTPRETLKLLRLVMEALDRAHKAGVVHRDISPDNIMLLKDGGIKVLDFGTARNLGSEAHSTELILKHGFAPAEQYLTRGDVGPWTDVYALCATAYYCMTGKVPPSALDRMMGGESISFDRMPGLTAEERRILNKGMAVRKEERYLSMAALSADLYDLPPVQPRPKKRISPKIWISAIAAVCVCVVGLTLALRHRHSWTEATCTESRTCQECGETEGDPLGHTWTKATMQTPRTCESCGITTGFAMAPRTVISAGYAHTVGLRVDGTVVATGSNYDGQCDVGAWKDIVSVAAGLNHTVGLRSDGTVAATGDNSVDQCAVDGWQDIVAIAAGEAHTVGLRSDGTVAAAGLYLEGKSELSTWRDIVAIAAGSGYTVGLCGDGTVVALGPNSCGECDVSGWEDIVAIAAGDTHTVGLRSDGTVVAVGLNSDGKCDVSGWQDIVAIAAGKNHTAGLRSDGTVVISGQAGNDMSDWTDIAAVTAGWGHTVGLRGDGTAVAVGSNMYGQCDVSGWTDIRLPDAPAEPKPLTQAPPLSWETWWNPIAVGKGHTVAIRSDGTVAAAGDNSEGQCNVAGWTDVVTVSTLTYLTVGLRRDGTVLSAGVEKSLVPTILSSWTEIVNIVVGSLDVVGVRSDGTVVATGVTGETQSILDGWTDIVEVGYGSDFIYGLRRDGTVVCTGETEATSWTDVISLRVAHRGQNDMVIGLRSDGTVLAAGNDQTGMLAVEDWTDIMAISVSSGHTVGLRRDGTVVAVGRNGDGQCEVGQWQDIVAIAASDWNTAGLRSDGTVVVAGSNYRGQCEVQDWTGIRVPEQ